MEVPHSGGRYEVRFGAWSALREHLPPRRLVVSDETVAGLHGGADLTVPPGEGSKSLEQYAHLLERLAGGGADRKTALVALGGGVVGDLVGFAAATYARGVPFWQVPTTLLAMVDSSVGGKVGVDLRAGKNLAGAFWPPQGVLIAPEFLRTLPARQVAAGMAEVWKMAFIRDAAFAAWLAARPVRAGGDVPEELIVRAVAHKRDVVAADEFETTGERATLNFGHTVGHALEKALGYEELLHGEAIAVGMAVEARLGERLGVTPPGVGEEVAARLREQGLPTRHPALARRDDLLAAMRGDKKATDGRLAFSLLTGLGACRLFTDVPPAEVVAALEG